MANYTINNIPNVADDVENADILPIWKTDEEKTAQVPVSKLMAGTKVTFASSTTVTGNTLASGDVLRIMFTSAITGSDSTTGLTITYNGTPYAVKVCKQGALADFVASEIDSAYYYLQAYTTLELAFNGGAFVIIGNPVVLSSDDYTIYADGVFDLLTYSTNEQWTGKYWTDGKKIYRQILTATDKGTGDFSFSQTLSNVDIVIKAIGFIKCTTGTYADSQFCVPRSNEEIKIVTSTGNIYLQGRNTSVNADYAQIQVDYTKTTD